MLVGQVGNNKQYQANFYLRYYFYFYTMEIKPYHKLFFFGSIALLIAYWQRERIKKGYRYAKEKLEDLIGITAGEWVGMKEIGNNQAFANQVFQDMMKKVGWKSSDQWCMYFAKAIHYEVFKDERENDFH